MLENQITFRHYTNLVFSLDSIGSLIGRKKKIN